MVTFQTCRDGERAPAGAAGLQPRGQGTLGGWGVGHPIEHEQVVMQACKVGRGSSGLEPRNLTTGASAGPMHYVNFQSHMIFKCLNTPPIKTRIPNPAIPNISLIANHPEFPS